MTALRRIFPYLLVLAFIAPPVISLADAPGSQWSWQRKSQPKPPPDKRPRDKAPEFDPSALGAVLVLLSGGALMFSRKRA